MYGVDGFELLVKMKKENVSVPPILFVTGAHNPMVKQNVLTQGVKFYLNKEELTQEMLCEAVEKAVYG